MKSYLPYSIIFVTLLVCNQEVYDMIYKALITKTLDSEFTKQDFDDRNNAIEILRKLCKGQVSSWESIK